MSTGDDEFPLSGERLHDRESIVHSPGMGILINDGYVERIEQSTELITEFAPWYPSKKSSVDVSVIDVGGMAIVPGFVDSHTHLVWAGDRANELALRQSGNSYQQIAEIGGGIWKTVLSTRSAPQERIVSSGLSRCQSFITNGTTSMEAKSGYGLDLETEVKILESVSMINRETPCNIVPTWLGAHDFPREKSRGEYMEELISEQLPVVNELGLAKWVDVFCEEGWFTNEETEDIVNAAKAEGLGSRLHVDEFVDSGGLELAAELGSVSGDHVACSNEDSRIAAAESGTVQTFLPGTPYILGKELDLPISKCIDEDF